jgi:hypothetical protein
MNGKIKWNVIQIVKLNDKLILKQHRSLTRYESLGDLIKPCKSSQWTVCRSCWLWLDITSLFLLLFLVGWLFSHLRGADNWKHFRIIRSHMLTLAIYFHFNTNFRTQQVEMGKKVKTNVDHKFTLFIKLSRRIPNVINISGFHEIFICLQVFQH